MKITDIISESSNKSTWEHYPLDKDTITGWGKSPRGGPGGFKPSKWQDRMRWDQNDKQDWEKSFPKDKPKEVDEGGIYNPNGKTFRGSGNPMPQFDPNDAMMQGDYDQLNTVTATDQGGIDKVESDIDKNRLKDIIRSGMKILTPEEREVLNLRYWHDLDHNKVGKKIGLNTDKVWKIEAKALRKLHDQSNAPEIRRYMDPTFKPKPAPMAIGNVVKSLSTTNGPKVGSYYEMGFKDAINGTKSMTRHNAMSSDETWDQRSQYDAGYESGKRKIKSSKVRESLSPFNDDHSELDQYVKEEFNRELDEVKFDPSRRGFLKKAGAVAASAAMPKGLAGAAMKAVTPSATSIISVPFAGLSAIDLDDIINLLDSAEAKNMRPGHDPYDLDIMKSIAQDAARESWGNAWFMNGNSAKSFIDAVELGRKNGMSDVDIIDILKSTATNLYADELEQLKPEDKREVQSRSLRNPNIPKNSELASSDADLEKVSSDWAKHSLNPLNKTSDTPSRLSSLARAAGAQIGRTMSNVGKATANTILNQPAKDMGKIEPTMSPIALPAPTKSGFKIPPIFKSSVRQAAKQYVDKNVDDVKSHVSNFYNNSDESPTSTVNPGMQIPKQKSKVSVSKKDDEDDKELERLKEMIRRS